MLLQQFPPQLITNNLVFQMVATYLGFNNMLCLLLQYNSTKGQI